MQEKEIVKELTLIRRQVHMYIDLLKNGFKNFPEVEVKYTDSAYEVLKKIESMFLPLNEEIMVKPDAKRSNFADKYRKEVVLLHRIIRASEPLLPYNETLCEKRQIDFLKNQTNRYLDYISNGK